MEICKRCILPKNFPHITFDDKGVCSLCRIYKGKEWANRLKREYKAEFEALIKRFAGKKEYDILMCYSGGKDSTYALSLLKNMYKLKILAFTFDNGFVPPRTYVNIRNVVEKLGIDHIFFKPRFDILKRIFKGAVRECLYSPKTIERASTVCTSCIGLVKYTALKLAIEKEIPFIGFGWSPGQVPVTSSILKIGPTMIKNMEKALKGPMSKTAGKVVETYFLTKLHYSKPDKFPSFIHPLAFLEYDQKKILNKVKGLGWIKPQALDLNSTNCFLNSLAIEEHKAKYDFHPYAFEVAELVRSGYISRREGLRRIEAGLNKKILKMIKKRLGI